MTAVDAHTADVEELVSQNPTRICVIGSGTHFLSGISYYTHQVAGALASRASVSVILMRRLIPKVFYPGKQRVGAPLSDVRYPAGVPVVDGVDWFWGRSILRAIALLVRERPDHIVLQWWTAAVAHTYLLLAVLARLLGARVVIEFHEVQDTGEARVPLAGLYARIVGRALVALSDFYVIHSEFDRPLIRERYGIDDHRVAVIPHGPYDHHASEEGPRLREAPEDMCNFVFFGTIRPYKGVEDLVEAFELLCDETPEAYWLTVLGETWEGWTLPVERIRSSRYRDRITLINRYLTDGEVSSWLAGADVSVLPYRRSSASGPLHVSMSLGLPTVVTEVGGLPEAVACYDGAVLAPVQDPRGLATAMLAAAPLRGVRFNDPHSWSSTADDLLRLVATAPATS